MSSQTRPSKSGNHLDAETWDALKAAGFSEDDLLADQPTGPVICSYTRAQAIDDGVLIDVTKLARKAGFVVPAAITCGVAAEMMELVRRERPKALEEHPEELVREAAYFGVLSVLHAATVDALHKGKDGRIKRITLNVEGVRMYAVMGPGDEGEPVLTVMLEGED